MSPAQWREFAKKELKRRQYSAYEPKQIEKYDKQEDIVAQQYKKLKKEMSPAQWREFAKKELKGSVYALNELKKQKEYGMKPQKTLNGKIAYPKPDLRKKRKKERKKEKTIKVRR
jgi:hypothetical protein